MELNWNNLSHRLFEFFNSSILQIQDIQTDEPFISAIYLIQIRILDLMR